MRQLDELKIDTDELAHCKTILTNELEQEQQLVDDIHVTINNLKRAINDVKKDKEKIAQ